MSSDASGTHPSVLDPNIRRLLLRLAAAAGILLIFAAVRLQTKSYIVTRKVSHWDNRHYDRLRFVDSNTVLGIRKSGTKAQIDRWSPARGDIQTYVLETGEAFAVERLRVSMDFSYAAWVADGELRVAALDGAPPRRIPLSTRSPLVDLGVMRSGILVLMYADSTLERWDAAKRTLLARQSLPLREPDQIAVNEEYIAAASSTEGRLVLYRQLNGDELRVVEEVKCPPPPFRLAIPGEGRAALITPGGIYLNGEHRNTPGRVSTLAFGRQSELFVSGDFDGVYSIPKEEQPYAIAAAKPGGRIVANEQYLIHTGQDGTTLSRIDLELRLTAVGRSMLWTGIIFVVLSVLLLMDHLFLALFRKVVRRKKSVLANVGPRFPSPPPDLVESMLTGAQVLWAGSGLGAQSGFPIRRNFIRELLDSGQFESWLSPADARRLTALCDRGKAEEAIDELVRGKPDNRNTVFSYVRLSFARTGSPSRSHESIGVLPFAAAITTNYDSTLEMMDPMWSQNVVHLRSKRVPERIHPGVFFVIKLYGDTIEPGSVLLSRSEMAQAAAESDVVTGLLRHALASTSVLFVGCSLEGLVEDLHLLRVPKPVGRKHFALAAVADNSWEKRAAELRMRWGVEVLPCVESEVQAALPEFLEALAESLRERLRPPDTERSETAMGAGACRAGETIHDR